MTSEVSNRFKTVPIDLFRTLMDGVLKGAMTSQRNYDTDHAAIAETLRVNLNPGAECSCVMVKGIMWIGKHNPVVGGVICPEEP